MQSNAKPTQLVINTNSWHYKHFCRVRRFFGVDTSPATTTSLCPYVQTMIWGSVLLVVTLPLQILGWLLLKGCRWLYKVSERIGLTCLVDCIDSFELPISGWYDEDGFYNKPTLGKYMEDCEESLVNNPFFILMSWAFIGIIGAAAVTLVTLIFTGLIVILVTALIQVIPELPSMIWSLICHLGWLSVLLAWAVVSVLIWFFTAGWFWVLMLKMLIYALSAIAICFVAGFILLKIGASNVFRKLLSFITMKFNGYKEARVEAQDRRSGKIPDYRPSWLSQIFTWPLVFIGRIGDNILDFFLSQRVEGFKTTKKIMSPCAMLWATIVAIKKRACPLVTFVDVDKLIEEEEVKQAENVVENTEETHEDQVEEA